MLNKWHNLTAPCYAIHNLPVTTSVMASHCTHAGSKVSTSYCSHEPLKIFYLGLLVHINCSLDSFFSSTFLKEVLCINPSNLMSVDSAPSNWEVWAFTSQLLWHVQRPRLCYQPPVSLHLTVPLEASQEQACWGDLIIWKDLYCICDKNGEDERHWLHPLVDMYVLCFVQDTCYDGLSVLGRKIPSASHTYIKRSALYYLYTKIDLNVTSTSSEEQQHWFLLISSLIKPYHKRRGLNYCSW